MGRVRNRAAEEDCHWNFKPRYGSHDKKNYVALAEKIHVALAERNHEALVGENHEVLGLPLSLSLGSWKARCSSNAELSLSCLEECRRNAAGRKGVKGLLLLGHEKMPCGFGLRTGDPSDTAGGAGNQGKLAS